MGRRLRLEFKGAIYHVIKRGNNREYIFQGRDDKESFLTYLQSAKEDIRFNLLGNVIIETKDQPIHIIMQFVMKNKNIKKNFLVLPIKMASKNNVPNFTTRYERVKGHIWKYNLRFYIVPGKNKSVYYIKVEVASNPAWGSMYDTNLSGF